MQSKESGEYNRIVSSGGDDPYMAFGVNNKESVRFVNDGDVSIGYAGDPSAVSYTHLTLPTKA